MNYEDFVRNHTGEIVERLLTDILAKDDFEINFDYEDNDQWSVVKIHIYEEDKEISLQLHANGDYELHFGYYDDEDEYHELIKKLTEEQVSIIPKGLQKAMQKVVNDESGMKLPGNFLSK